MRSICTQNYFRFSAKRTGSCSQCSLIRTHFCFAAKSAARWFVYPVLQLLMSLPAGAKQGSLFTVITSTEHCFVGPFSEPQKKPDKSQIPQSQLRRETPRS